MSTAVARQRKTPELPMVVIRELRPCSDGVLGHQYEATVSVDKLASQDAVGTAGMIGVNCVVKEVGGIYGETRFR